MTPNELLKWLFILVIVVVVTVFLGWLLGVIFFAPVLGWQQNEITAVSRGERT